MNRNLPTFLEGEDHVKISHFTRKEMDISGIIHVGTNDWYEYPWYRKMGIDNLIGFEPLIEAVRRAEKAYSGAVIYTSALGNIDGFMELQIASGDGQSSTLLGMTRAYQEQFPGIQIIENRTVRVTKFITWAKRHFEVDLKDYNCLVVDVEGMELEVLKGMGSHLDNFEMLNIECSGKPTYVNGPSAQDIVDFLEAWGFDQDTPIEPHNDIMFVKRKDL